MKALCQDSYQLMILRLWLSHAVACQGVLSFLPHEERAQQTQGVTLTTPEIRLIWEMATLGIYEFVKAFKCQIVGQMTQKVATWHTHARATSWPMIITRTLYTNNLYCYEPSGVCF